MRIEASTCIVRLETLIETLVGSEIVLMDVDSGKCFGLGPTGSDVWRLLEKPTTPAAAADSLSREYEAPASQIQDDVLELVNQLFDQHLLQIC